MVIVLDNFRGVDQSAHPTRIERRCAADARNLVFSRGTAAVRPGRVRHCAGGGEARLWEYHNPELAPATRLLSAIGGAFYTTTDTSQTVWEAIAGASYTGSSPRGATYAGWFYWVDGINFVRRWHPTHGVEELFTLPEPATPVIELSSSQQTLHRRLGDPLGLGFNHVKGSGTHVWTNRNLWCPHSITGDDLRGTCVRLLSAPENVFRGHASTVALELIGTRDDAGAYNAQALFLRRLTDQYPDGVDLSAVNALVVSLALVLEMQAESGVLPQIFLEFGTSYTDFANSLAQSVQMDLSGIEVSTLTDRSELVDVEVPLGSVAAEDRTGIKYLGLRVVCGGSPNHRACDRLEPSNDVWKYLVPLGTNWQHAITILVDDITAAQSSPNFVTNGTYSILCTYGWQESAVVEGPESVTAEITMPASEAQLPLALTIREQLAELDPAPDYLYVYARGGQMLQYRRILEFALADVGSEISGTWDGFIPSGAAALIPYASAPPAGCAMLLEWMDRMVYARADTAYISNIMDPTRVPNQALLDMAGAYGGRYAVGSDGRPITGLGRYRNNLMLFKRTGIWLAEERGGAPPFAIIQVDDVYGCVSQESIQGGDNLLVWQGPGKILSWDDRVQDIGRDVEDFLAGVSVIRQEAAYSYIDPERQLLVMVYPPGVPATETPAAEAVVLDFSRQGVRSLSIWDGLPEACAVYAAHAATRGIYAADAYAPGYVYRLHTGMTDATASATAAPIAWRMDSAGVQVDPRAYASLARVEAYLDLAQTQQAVRMEVLLDGSSTPALSRTPAPVSSLSRTGHVVTAVTATAHGAAAGERIIIRDSGGLDGLFTVASVIDAVTLTYADAGADLSVSAGTLERCPPGRAGGAICWHVPAHAPAGWLQVRLSGASRTGGEIIALVAELLGRGRI